MEPKGFITVLFDLSFTEFITTRIIKVLYILGIFFSGLGSLAVLVGGVTSGSVVGALGALIITPVIFVLYVLMVRVWLELIIVIFRIAENTGRMVNLQKDAAE